MRKTLTVLTLIMAIFLTACSYNLDELEINKEDNPGWRSSGYSGYIQEIRHIRYLEVSYSSFGRTKSEPEQELTYLVFASSADAREYYTKWRKYCRSMEYERDSGTNWFVTKEPNTYDVVMFKMYYLEGNVIIQGDVEVTYYSTENGGTSSTTVTRSEGAERKEYILKNHSRLRKYAMDLFK